MKRSIFIILFVLSISTSFSQEKYITRNGSIRFLSETSIETINPINNHVSCILDTKTGDIVFQLKIISFEFEKALMEEHFNEKYMESEKYPKSTFIGKIKRWDHKLIANHVRHEIEANGIITIHGVEKEIQALGSLKIDEGSLIINATFDLLIADFNIKIPKIVKNNISEIVKVDVDVTLKQN